MLIVVLAVEAAGALFTALLLCMPAKAPPSRGVAAVGSMDPVAGSLIHSVRAASALACGAVFVFTGLVAAGLS